MQQDQVLPIQYQHHVAHRLIMISVYKIPKVVENSILTVQLNVLLLKEEIVLHSLLHHLEPPPPHKIVMEMEYLTQLIGVLITLIQDASTKERLVQQQQPHSKSNLLLIGLGTKRDKEIER